MFEQYSFQCLSEITRMFFIRPWLTCCIFHISSQWHPTSYIYIYIYSIQNCHLTFLNSCHNIYLYSWIINISMIFHVTSLSLTAKQITGIFSLRYKKQLFFRSPDLPSTIFCDTLSHLTSRKKFRSHFYFSISK